MRLPTEEELKLIKEYNSKECTEKRKREIIERLDEIAKTFGIFN